MKKKKPLFNTKQRVILQTLNKSNIGLTTYDISKRTGIAWVTVKKHIKELEKKNIVKCPKIKPLNKKMCKLNFDLIYGRKK
ncbi:MAG: winged helix-turn-helix transcriptional regulator [Atribacterota bacterium]